MVAQKTTCTQSASFFERSVRETQNYLQDYLQAKKLAHNVYSISDQEIAVEFSVTDGDQTQYGVEIYQHGTADVIASVLPL